MIRFWCLFFICCACVGGSASAYTQEELCRDENAYVPIAERLQPGLLFKLEKCGVEPSYLFGTIHTDQPDLLKNNAKAVDALQSSRIALFELVQSNELQQEVVRYMLYPTQQRDGLSHAIGLELYEQALTHMQRLQPDMPPAFFNRYRPWAAAILLQYPPQTGDGIVLDARMQTLAQQQHIAVAGLETAAEQFSFFRTLSAEEQRLMMVDAIDRMDEIRQINRELFEAYGAKDLLTIYEIGETSFAAFENPVFAEKMKHFLITERNRKMVVRMIPHLNKGRTFIAVGALHLLGNDGLLATLEEKGFSISQAD
jgi:uncharacterized protein YbaP (TraB family)